jgi:hypothetical protein
VLTLRSYPGERAKIVAGTADLQNLTSVVVVYASGVTIEDLEVQGGSYYGIKLDDAKGPASDIGAHEGAAAAMSAPTGLRVVR